MTLSEICKGISLQPALCEAVLDFAQGYDFTEAEKLTDSYFDFSKLNDVTSGLKGLLGEDKGNVKFLASVLNAACKTYEKYKEKGATCLR